MTDLLLLGDSHLALVQDRRRRALERFTGCRVENRAIGGVSSLELADQLRGGVRADVVVVSVGTNDAAPWKQVPLPAFERALRDAVGTLAGARLVYLASPGVVEELLTGPDDRRNGVLEHYSAVGRTVFAEAGGTTVDTPALLAGSDGVLFEEDGVHLTDEGYGVVLPALAQAVTTVATRSG